MNETAPDEDVYAIDCDLKYPRLTLPVQVKCTAKHALPTTDDPWFDVHPDWADKWDASILPVHVVLVIVQAEPDGWLDHHDNGTWHPSVAYWIRWVKGHRGRTRFPLDQRLDAGAVVGWYESAMTGFTGAA